MSHQGPATFVELRGRDLEKTKAFYGELLGWTFENVPLPDGTHYTMAKSRPDAPPVAGLASDAQPQALVYFTVANCKTATERARRLGARIELDTAEVPTMGFMTILTDPQGARVALWQEARRA